MTREGKSLRMLWAIAIAASLLGVVLTVRNFAVLPRGSERWDKKSADRTELQAIRKAVERQERMVASFESLPATPTDLPALAKKQFGKAVATRELEPMPTIAGWTARRVGLAAEDVAGDDVGHFLAEAAEAKPPWGVTECVLLASGKSGRLAKVELTLVAVEKAGR